MTLNPLNLDARNLEVRANELISYLDLISEGYTEFQAGYDEKTWTFIVESESTICNWFATNNHLLTEEDWEQIQCWIHSFTHHGCSSTHEHYSPF